MTTGTTSTGFKFSVNENITSDWRFINAIVDAESEDETTAIKGTTAIAHLLLSPKEEKRLMNHVMTEDGIIPIDAMNAEIIEIFKAIGDTPKGKN